MLQPMQLPHPPLLAVEGTAAASLSWLHSPSQLILHAMVSKPKSEGKATKQHRRSQTPKPWKFESFKCLALQLWHISSGEGLDARCIWGLHCCSNNIWRSQGPWSHHVRICAHPTHWRLDHHGDHRNKRKSNQKQFEFPLLCSNRDFKVTEESFLFCTFRLLSLTVNLLATARTLNITCHSFLP